MAAIVIVLENVIVIVTETETVIETATETATETVGEVRERGTETRTGRGAESLTAGGPEIAAESGSGTEPGSVRAGVTETDEGSGVSGMAVVWMVVRGGVLPPAAPLPALAAPARCPAPRAQATAAETRTPVGGRAAAGTRG